MRLASAYRSRRQRRERRLPELPPGSRRHGERRQAEHDRPHRAEGVEDLQGAAAAGQPHAERLSRDGGPCPVRWISAAGVPSRSRHAKVGNMTIEAQEAAPSVWEPLRNPVFRALWLAVLGSQIGTWMQTVGAQWLLVDEPNAATLVSLVQTAMMLPILLFAVPAGVLADSLDRRRMLIVVQFFQAGAGAFLTALAAVGQLTPALLLTLTFVLGCGGALTIPTYQALIPGLVPRPQLHAAAGLGAISMNVARAVGPAAAGVLVAQVGPAAVFALNTATLLVFAIVLLLWRRHPTGDEHDPEPFVAALRAGGRFVRHSPAMRRFLLR